MEMNDESKSQLRTSCLNCYIQPCQCRSEWRYRRTAGRSDAIRLVMGLVTFLSFIRELKNELLKITGIDERDY